MSARLTVLGSRGAWPERGRACNGFLLEFDGFRVVLDLGYGTLPRLLSLLGSDIADGLDAIVISHSHPDHLVDAHGLLRARLYGGDDLPRIPLYAPAGVPARLASLEEDDAAAVTDVFEWFELPAKPLACGPFTLTSVELPHFVRNVGVRLDSYGLALAYTGDTGPSKELTALGQDVDVFVVDATDRHQQPGRPEDEGPMLLLDGAAAGKAAASAGAKRLLLTHFWPGNDREQTRREAERHFDGEVIVADEGLVLELSRRS